MLATRYERELHKYSGLDPELWFRFKRNIRAFEDEKDVPTAAKYLYTAMENIRDLGLSIRRSDDSHIQDDLDLIAERLGIEGEYELYTSAKKKGFYFFPRYLNETADASTDDDTFKRGGTVGDPGTHFPAPRSGTRTRPASEDAFWSNGEKARALHPDGGVRG
jgi:hypothetical protein